MSEQQCPIGTYYDGWNEGKIDKMASVLDPDLVFRGPMESHDSAASFLKSCEAMMTDPKNRDLRIEDFERFIDGDKVAIFYTLKGGPKPVPMAEHFTVKDGRIKQIKLYFDPAQFGGQA